MVMHGIDDEWGNHISLLLRWMGCIGCAPLPSTTVGAMVETKMNVPMIGRMVLEMLPTTMVAVAFDRGCCSGKQPFLGHAWLIGG